jgi:histidine triad (HIT) family protein
MAKQQKHPVVAELEKAAKGLMFPSESDAPMNPFLWEGSGDKLNQDRLRQLAQVEKGTTVETLSLEDVLKTVPSEDQPKFQKLIDTIKQQLSGVKVYKLGDEPERQVFVVGKTADGHLAGLKTTVVET